MFHKLAQLAKQHPSGFLAASEALFLAVRHETRTISGRSVLNEGDLLARVLDAHPQLEEELAEAHRSGVV